MVTIMIIMHIRAELITVFVQKRGSIKLDWARNEGIRNWGKGLSFEFYVGGDISSFICVSV